MLICVYRAREKKSKLFNSNKGDIMLSELKKELSKLAGIDFFNPKYRDVFKKYLPEEKDAEEEKLEALDVPVDEVKEIEEPKVEEEKAVEDKVADVEKAEDEREIDKIEEEKGEEPAIKEEKKEEVKDESEEIGKDVDELKDDKIADELLDAKIELELVKGGVRPEKLEPAKRFAKYEIHDLEDIGKVSEILKEYPEWVKGYSPRAFGISVDEHSDGLTEEEKRLKQMGINPQE